MAKFIGSSKVHAAAIVLVLAASTPFAYSAVSHSMKFGPATPAPRPGSAGTAPTGTGKLAFGPATPAPRPGSAGTAPSGGKATA